MATPEFNDPEDALLNSFLDDLIVSGRNDMNDAKADATTSQHDVTFTSDTLHDGVHAANALLSSSGLPALPLLVTNRPQSIEISDAIPPATTTTQGIRDEANGPFVKRHENIENSNIEGNQRSLQVAPRVQKQPNYPTVLAAALTALVRVCRANSANLSLRQRAEARAVELETELAGARNTASTLRTRLESAKDASAAAKSRADAVVRERDNLIRRHAAEATEIRTRLQIAVTREKALVQKVQQRDKETALLKQRVLSLIEAPRGTPLLQRITSAQITSSRKSASPRAVRSKSQLDSRKEMTEKVEKAKNARVDIIEEENQVFRNLLRAIQEELDDLLVICDVETSPMNGFRNDEHAFDQHAVDQHENAEHINEGGEVDKSSGENEVKKVEKGDDTSETPKLAKIDSVTEPSLADQPNTGSTGPIAPAPTEEQMRLPFEMIRDEFEESLDRKFCVIRIALSEMES